MVNELTNENFNEIINSKDVAVVKIKTTWCNPCKQLSPIIEEVSSILETVYFGEVDAEKNSDLATSLSIRSVPTTIIYKNGEEVERFSGVKQKNVIIKLIQEYI
jgi:thioredoxin 1